MAVLYKRYLLYGQEHSNFYTIGVFFVTEKEKQQYLLNENATNGYIFKLVTLSILLLNCLFSSSSCLFFCLRELAFHFDCSSEFVRGFLTVQALTLLSSPSWAEEKRNDQWSPISKLITSLLTLRIFSELNQLRHKY